MLPKREACANEDTKIQKCIISIYEDTKIQAFFGTANLGQGGAAKAEEVTIHAGMRVGQKRQRGTKKSGGKQKKLTANQRDEARRQAEAE